MAPAACRSKSPDCTQIGCTVAEVPENLQVKKTQNLAPKSLDRNEQNALIRKVKDGGSKRDVAVIQLLLGTGLRKSEAMNLLIDDIEIFHRATTDEKGVVHVRDGKGGRFRDIPMNTEVRRAIRDYLEVRPDNHKQNLLFLGERGKLTRGGVDYIGMVHLPTESPLQIA